MQPLYITIELPLFSSSGTIFFCFYAQVTWHDEKPLISLLNEAVDLHLSRGYVARNDHRQIILK